MLRTVVPRILWNKERISAGNRDKKTDLSSAYYLARRWYQRTDSNRHAFKGGADVIESESPVLAGLLATQH
jgi:hypothetical protein